MKAIFLQLNFRAVKGGLPPDVSISGLVADRPAAPGTSTQTTKKPVCDLFISGAVIQPPDDAAWTKYLLGHVGPGIEENQLSQTTNSFAREFRTVS